MLFRMGKIDQVIQGHSIDAYLLFTTSRQRMHSQRVPRHLRWIS